MRHTTTIAFLLACAGTAGADNPPKRRGPPPEAIAACKEKSAGDTCTMDLHGHTLDGICRTGPDGNGPLACAPDRPPPGAPPPGVESDPPER